jgi:hypothetical protein
MTPTTSEKSEATIPYDQFSMVMLKAHLELVQKIDQLLTTLQDKQQPYADKAAVSNDRISVDSATGDVSVGNVKQEQKRPQNCGTSYCSCIECVMDEQEQVEPVGEAYLCDCCLTPFDGAYECPSCGHNTSTKEPVYTKPQQRAWVGLTQADKQAFIDQDFGGNRLDAMDYAEKILKEKNA